MMLQKGVDDVLGIRLEIACGNVENIVWASEWADSISLDALEQCRKWLHLTQKSVDDILNNSIFVTTKGSNKQDVK